MISLEGLRWVEGLYGGFILLAPLSSYSSKCLFLSKRTASRSGVDFARGKWVESEILKSHLSIKPSSEKRVAKSCRITCHKLNSIIVIKIIAVWVFKNTKSVYLRAGYKFCKRMRRRRRRETKGNQKNEERRGKQKILHCVKKSKIFLIWSV